MRATVTDVERSSEGGKTVLRFVLQLQDQRVVPVEMRGDEIRGLVRERDEVDLPEQGLSDEHGWTPNQVFNLTTNRPVTAWQAPFYRRYGRTLVSGLVGGVLSALGTWIVAVVLPGNDTQGIDIEQGPSSAELVAWAFVVLSALVLIAAVIAWFVRSPENRPTPSQLAAEVGVFVGTLVVALSISF